MGEPSITKRSFREPADDLPNQASEDRLAIGLPRRGGLHLLRGGAADSSAALALLRERVLNEGVVLFVAVASPLGEATEHAAILTGMPYVTDSWANGLITNWVTMQQRITHLASLRRLKAADISLDPAAGNELDRLEAHLGGLVTRGGDVIMHRLPDVLVVVDFVSSDNAAPVREAQRIGIPIIAIGDTDAQATHEDCLTGLQLVTESILDAYDDPLTRQQSGPRHRAERLLNLDSRRQQVAVRVQELRRLIAFSQDQLTQGVAELRELEMSWSQIGRILEMTPQGAQQRFGKRVDAAGASAD